MKLQDKAHDSELLRHLQEKSFGYFVHEVNRKNGLVLDKTEEDWPASIAAIGMALTAYPVGVERHFMERTEAAERTLTTLRFFADSEQSEAEDATGYRGFYYHFLHMHSGKRAWGSELSSIDTALFIAGALAAAAYFDGADADEAEIRSLATLLYERVEWAWLLQGKQTLCHGWKPEREAGFLGYRWEGYDEALILYLLALGSPTHPIPRSSYDAWCSTYEWKEVYGIGYLYAGPLFIHQLSHVWVDFRGIRDAYMREKDSDYFENSRRATMVQQQYGARNPLGLAHMGELCWGLTASDGPGPKTKRIAGVERSFYDYIARGVPYGPDDGTLAPWAVVASLPFAPEIVLPTVMNLRKLQIQIANPYGFKASINPLFLPNKDDGIGWVSRFHFGINEGPTVLMIENYRSGLVWSLMRRCTPLVAGLRAAGFTGGWLDAPPARSP
ncbi:MAG: glucoamylase family protein [Caldimonas sp.]